MKHHPKTRAERLNKQAQAKAKAKAYLYRIGMPDAANDPVVVGVRAKHPKCDCHMCKPEKFQRHMWRKIDLSDL